jgi:hypothetical protein
MKFSIATAIAACAASVVAAPPGQASGNGVGNTGNSNVRFPVSQDTTVEQASTKCGDQAQLSCCNEVTYAGDTTTEQQGVLAGALSGLLGQGSGSEGLGLFKGCSKLNVAGEYLEMLPNARKITNVLQLLSVSRTSSTRTASRTLLAARTLPPRPYVSYPSLRNVVSLTHQQNGDLIGVGLPCVALGSLL